MPAPGAWHVTTSPPRPLCGAPALHLSLLSFRRHPRPRGYHRADSAVTEPGISRATACPLVLASGKGRTSPCPLPTGLQLHLTAASVPVGSAPGLSPCPGGHRAPGMCPAHAMRAGAQAGHCMSPIVPAECPPPRLHRVLFPRVCSNPTSRSSSRAGLPLTSMPRISPWGRRAPSHRQ